MSICIILFYLLSSGMEEIKIFSNNIQLDPSHKKYNEKKLEATFEVYTTLNFTYVFTCSLLIPSSSCFFVSEDDYCSDKKGEI